MILFRSIMGHKLIAGNIGAGDAGERARQAVMRPDLYTRFFPQPKSPKLSSFSKLVRNLFIAFAFFLQGGVLIPGFSSCWFCLTVDSWSADRCCSMQAVST